MLKNPTHQIILLVTAIAMVACIAIQSCTDQSSNVPNPNVITVNTTPIAVDTIDYNRVFYCLDLLQLDTASVFVVEKIKVGKNILEDIKRKTKALNPLTHTPEYIKERTAELVQERTDTYFGLQKAYGEQLAIRDFRKLNVDGCVPFHTGEDNIERVEAGKNKTLHSWEAYKKVVYATGRTKAQLTKEESTNLNGLHMQFEKSNSHLDLLMDFYSNDTFTFR